MTVVTDRSLRLYAPLHVTLATAIGGPLATGVLLAANYRIIGQPSAARSTVLGGILATLLVVGIMWFLPEGLLDLLLAATYLGISHEVVRRLQGSYLKAHRSAGGDVHSPWRAVGVGLACLTVVVALIAILLLLVPERWLPEL